MLKFNLTSGIQISCWHITTYIQFLCYVFILQNMFDLTLSQALGFSNKKEADIATSSKLNKVVLHLFSLKFMDCREIQNELKDTFNSSTADSHILLLRHNPFLVHVTFK